MRSEFGLQNIREIKTDLNMDNILSLLSNRQIVIVISTDNCFLNISKYVNYRYLLDSAYYKLPEYSRFPSLSLLIILESSIITAMIL